MARAESQVHAVPTVAGVTALLLLLVTLALWATGGNDSMSYYQHEVSRAMRRQSRQEKTDLAAKAQRHRLRRCANRLNATLLRRTKPDN